MRTKVTKSGHSGRRQRLAKAGQVNADPQLTPIGFLNQREAAKVVGQSERTLRRWMRDGIIPYFRLGKKRIRFKRSDLEAHFNNCLVAARS